MLQKTIVCIINHGSFNKCLVEECVAKFQHLWTASKYDAKIVPCTVSTQTQSEYIFNTDRGAVVSVSGGVDMCQC